MHEFELGVWKAVFKHLLRILYAHDGNSLPTLNTRYRNTPTFGRETIRKIKENVSGAKQLAARDYEDLLQCAVPAFSGFLPPEHDKIVSGMLFELATWHALAKLRLHTETTLKFLRASTKRLGKDFRLFSSKVCSAYDTRELPTEEAARRQRRAAGPVNLSTANHTAASAKGKGCTFNLQTFKMHAMGHYEECIRLFGTSDGYNTQTVWSS
jgi:hypothetical protein